MASAEGRDVPTRRPAPTWQRVFPVTRWFLSYDREAFRHDVVSGLTVAVMLIPQSMAYARLMGVPPLYGLYASTVPLLIYPLFGTSLHLAVGIFSLDALIASAGLGDLALRGSEDYVRLAVLLALMVGVIQVAMGLARMGFLVNLLSRPVMVGFTSGAALLIVLSQVGDLVGLDLAPTRHLHDLIFEAARHLHEMRPAPVAVGLGAVLLLIGLRRWKPHFPGPLVVLALATALVWALGVERSGVAVVGPIPRGLPGFQVPVSDPASVRALLPTAVTLALVQFMTVASLAKVFASRHRYDIGPNNEVLALGVMQAVGSLFRSVPVSGSFTRTAVNVHAGGRTPLFNWVTACGVGLTLLFLTPLLTYVPVAVLAAIIVVAASGLFDVGEMRLLMKIRRSDGVVALVTFGSTLVVGAQEGILVGVTLAVVVLLYRIGRPSTAVLGHLPGTRSFGDVRAGEAKLLEGILILRVDASFSFMNAEYLKDIILRLSKDPEHGARVLVLDASAIIDLDATAVSVLRSIKDTLDERGVPLYLAGVKEGVREVLVRSGLKDRIGPDHFFLSAHRAVRHILRGWGRSEEYLSRLPGAEAIERR